MDKLVSCKDLGSGCDFTVCAKTEVELFKGILEHGHAVHHMKEFSPEFYEKVRSSIQEGYCDLEDELCKYGECPSL